MICWGRSTATNNCQLVRGNNIGKFTLYRSDRSSIQYIMYRRMLSKVNYKIQQRCSPSYNYVSVHSLLICRKHLHDCINSLRGEVWAHKSSLTPPLFLEVSVSSQESGWTSISVSGFDFCLILRFFLLDFEMFRQCGIYLFFILLIYIVMNALN